MAVTIRAPRPVHATRRPAPRRGAAALALVLLAGLALPAPSLAASVTASAATARTVASVGSNPVPVFTDALRAKLTSTLALLRTKNHLPGLQVAIRFPNGTVWDGHAGFANVAGRRALTNFTLFDAGSITKTFVAALTVQLAGQGVLSLDDPLSKWIPDLPFDDGVTLRQMLDHTSGIFDPFMHPALNNAIVDHPATVFTPARVISYVGAPLFTAGQGWSYSNANYILLGQVIEKATGQTLASLLRKRFLVPLHLANTFLQSEEPISGAAATGYTYTSDTTWALKSVSVGSRYVPYASLATAIGSAGSLVTTADDLARWALYLYRNKVLPPALLSQMLDFSLTAPFHPKLPYGLGVQRRSLSGWGSWGHDGAIEGFHSSMRYFPAADGISIVVLTNSDHVDPDILVEAFLDDIFPPA